MNDSISSCLFTAHRTCVHRQLGENEAYINNILAKLLENKHGKYR